MAGTNAAKVYIGTLEQSSTVGALMRGPVLTSIPSTFAEALAAISGFDSCGYMGDDGPTLTTELGTNDLREHNGMLVRKAVQSLDASVKGDIIQADYDGWCMVFGKENVTRVAANSEHGELIHISIGARLPEPQAWALRIKDGDYRMIVLVPNGQLASEVEITFNASDPIGLPVEISGLDDGTSNAVHIYVDDGEGSSADVNLSALTVGTLSLSPTFDAATTEYTATTSSSSVNVTAAAAAAGATVAVKNGSTTVTNGSSASLSAGQNAITVTVTNGTASKVYTVNVTKS